LWRRGVLEAYTSPQILSEFERVLLGPKFKLPKEIVSNLVGYITALMHVIATRRNLEVIREDLADNRIIECALEAEADFIVRGNRHLLALREFEGIKIRTTSETLKLINES
jgi:putative PIN family toxin of toxin-antitoxin system